MIGSFVVEIEGGGSVVIIEGSRDLFSLEGVIGCSAVVTEGSDEAGEVNLFGILSVAELGLVSAVVFEGAANVPVVEEAGEIVLLCIFSLSVVEDGSTETLVDSNDVLVDEEALVVALVVSPVLDNFSSTVAKVENTDATVGNA